MKTDTEQTPVHGKAPTTDFCELLPDIAAGVLIKQLEYALTNVAACVVEHGNKGVVTLKLELNRIGQSCQVNCTSSLISNAPGRRKDSVVETRQHETPLFVGAGGALSVTPETVPFDLQKGGHSQTILHFKGTQQ